MTVSVVVLGGSGLVGSSLIALWGDRWELIAPSHAQLDVLDDHALSTFLAATPAAVVVNLVAWADVDGAEAQRGDKHGRVYQLNARLPTRLSVLCEELGKYLVHVSTDYVFDGTQSDRAYAEGDQPNPLSWYAQTKRAGETGVLDSHASACVARIEMPFTGRAHQKLDFARLCAARLALGQGIKGVADQRITPVFLDDCAAALRVLVDARYAGLIHVAAPDWTTPYLFARSIAERMRLDASLIEHDTFEKFSKTRPAPRPQHPWLDVSSFSARFGDNVLRPVEATLDVWCKQVRS